MHFTFLGLQWYWVDWSASRWGRFHTGRGRNAVRYPTRRQLVMTKWNSISSSNRWSWSECDVTVLEVKRQLVHQSQWPLISITYLWVAKSHVEVLLYYLCFQANHVVWWLSWRSKIGVNDVYTSLSRLRSEHFLYLLYLCDIVLLSFKLHVV